MDTFMKRGAMYAYIENPNKIKKIPIELGDKKLYPGQYVKKLGHKKRTSFEMQEGFYLRYIGKCNNYLLFLTNSYKEDESSKYYYTFGYVDKNTLVIGGRKGMSDIRIETLDVFENVPIKIMN